MINVRELAKKSTVLAAIMEDRTKGDTEELIARKEVVHIIDCELCTITNEGAEDRVWAYTIKEEPKKFYFAGYVLKKIFESILDECEGDYTEMYSAVSSQGIPVKFSQQKTKDGKRVFTAVEVM